MKKSQDLRRKFFDKFDYFPEEPFEVIMGEKDAVEKYCEILQNCINDEFDYTIELYGTVPKKSEGLSHLIID